MWTHFHPVKFIVVVAVCAYFCPVVWEKWVHYKLYNCTDDFGPVDFYIPGYWVRNPVEVDVVVEDGIMEHPDTIKAGWSIPKLWALWFAILVAPVIVGTVVAAFPWWHSKSDNKEAELILNAPA